MKTALDAEKKISESRAEARHRKAMQIARVQKWQAAVVQVAKRVISILELYFHFSTLKLPDDMKFRKGVPEFARPHRIARTSDCSKRRNEISSR